MTRRAALEQGIGHIPRAELVRAVRAERARRSFGTFVRLVRPDYKIEPYQQVIIDEIQSWATAEEPYPLVLSMPPGHGKSEYAKLAVAWLTVRDLSARHAYASYTKDLAEDSVEDVCSILESERVQALWGAIIPPKGQPGRTKEEIDVGGAADGALKAVGRETGLTGRRIDHIVADDLIKDDIEAQSPTTRDSAWRWITRVALTRKRPDRPLRLLVVATRWHLDDPTSRVLAKLPRAREVRFAALKVGPPTPDDPREDGEALWPAVADMDVLHEMRAVDPMGFAALYQQHPVPDGGALFLASWIKRAGVLPAIPGRFIQSWDLRGGGKQDRGSYAVGQLWWQPHAPELAGQVYLVDQVRGRWSPEETLAQIVAAQGRPQWRAAAAKLIESKADGVAALSILARQIPGLLPVKPTADKVTRARAVSAFFAAGNVYLLDFEGVEEYIAELVTFPAAANDDQVDATTQALDHLLGATRRVMTMPKWEARAGRGALA